MKRTRSAAGICEASTSASQPSTSASQPSTSAGLPRSRLTPALSQTQTQNSQNQTQAEKNAERLVARMEPAEVSRKVEEIVQYLLVMEPKKFPIKKLDISKAVLKENGRALPELMKRASEHLLNVFGIEVVELQGKLKGSCILINSVEKSSGIIPWPDTDNAKTGLLTVILSIIFMSGNVLQDGELWQGLKGFGIDPDVHHETFGDVKKLVTQEFVRQAYLDFTKLPCSEQPVFEVRWGQRAMHETTKVQILKFVSLLYNREPEEWTAQYHDARNNEEDMTT